MKRSLVRALIAVCAIAALVTALPLAQAGTPNRNHAVNATVKAKDIETKGPVVISAGILRDRRLGEGATILRTSSAGGNTLDLKFKVWYGAGLQRGEGTITFVVQPDGSTTFTGNARYTGGTGRFRGVTGQLQIRDGVFATDGLITTTVTGNARY
jgi:hypothetical protein